MFENENDRKVHTAYYLPKVDIKEYNVMMDGQKIYNQSARNDIRRYGNIKRTSAGQGDDYRTDCLLDYPYFKEYYKLIAIDLSKLQALDPDPKAIQQLILLKY